MPELTGFQCLPPLALPAATPENSAAEHPEPPFEACSRFQTLLAELRANDDLMARLAAADIEPDRAPQQSAPADPTHSFPVIDGYEILAEIHRGGQGVVYRATQRATNRTVALKVLLAGAFAAPRQRRRFEREIELVAHLEHPNIVTVYDSGQAHDGCHYFAMQYVEGVPLDQWLSERHNDAQSAPHRALHDLLRHFARLCDGVSYAHQHGVIHRDLKPANIIVDAVGEPHILDFGLARPIDDAQYHAHTALTLDGTFLGTLAYAAPEQTRGDPSLIDVRSDVYSLGVMLYQMLTGHFPYPVEGDLSAVLKAITTAPPRPPSKWAVKHHDGYTQSPCKVDDELETIVLKALAKEKERRYQSAAALRDDIGHYLAGEPLEAKRNNGWYILKKSLARYRVQVSIAVAFVVLLIVFSVSMLSMYRRASIEADKARQINIFLQDTLSTIQPAQRGQDVSVRDLLDEAARWIDIALAEQPEVRASIQTTIGNSYRSLGRLAEAEVHLQAALQTRRELFGDQHLEVARSMSLIAVLRHDQGRLDEAEQLFNAALTMQRELTGDERYDVYTLANLAQLRCDQRDYAAAEHLLSQSLAIRRRLLGDVNPSVAMCHYSLAHVYEGMGDLAQAESHHRTALDMRRATLHRHHPDLSESLYALGTLLLHSDRAAQAELLLRECLTLRRETLGDEHWLVDQTRAALDAALAATPRSAPERKSEPRA